MAFVYTQHGLVNLDHVASVTEDGGSLVGTKYHLWDKSDKPLGYSFQNPADVLPVVAALPGFNALEYFASEDPDTPGVVEAWPVVAWQLSGREPLPIVHNPSEEGFRFYDIELPDGRVICAKLHAFANREAWFEFNERMTRERIKKVPAKSEA